MKKQKKKQLQEFPQQSNVSSISREFPEDFDY